MGVREQVLEYIADAFGMQVNDLDENMNFVDDLHAKSMNFFPIINGLNDEYDLDINYQTFRKKCHTVGEAIKFYEAEV